MCACVCLCNGMCLDVFPCVCVCLCAGVCGVCVSLDVFVFVCLDVFACVCV